MTQEEEQLEKEKKLIDDLFSALKDGWEQPEEESLENENNKTRETPQENGET